MIASENWYGKNWYA